MAAKSAVKEVASTVSRWEQFVKNIQQDMKLYVFMLGVFCLFRVAFIVVLHPYISEAATWRDIVASLYYGLRISLKSAGLAVLLSMVVCTFVNLLINSEKLERVRLWLGGAYMALLSLLFFARIPYYEQFHMAFNQFIFNTLKDDVEALFYTMVQQYNLPLRVLLAAATAWLLTRVLKAWLNTRTFPLPQFSKWYYNVAFRACLLILFYQLTIFIRFGGSMTYAYNMDWENSGITRDEFLNEAILDDVQALYRAYTLHERVAASTGLDLDPGKIKEYGSYLLGHPLDSSHIDDYLKKEAQGAKVERPKHIFLIVAESYASWPLEPQYQNLHIADGVKQLIAKENSIYIPHFLPNGMSTISGVMGVVTGLAEANLYLNYLPESYAEPYATSLAPQLKKLGYTADFWYAGPSSWERVKDFSLSQGFDHFYSAGDIASESGNVWGCDDKYLWQAVAKGVKDDQPGFHLILNISNHAPYTVPLEQEGFTEDLVKGGLPEHLKEDKEFIKKLGHFWYGDKVLTEFISQMEERYPDSLFLLVGDHADRLNLENNPTMYRRYSIPFLIYGKGVKKSMIPKKAAGSHINVGATLLEFIAPKGFTYYSVGNSLTRGNELGFNYGFWITGDWVGKIGSEGTKYTSDGGTPPAQERIMQEVEAMRAVSWWRIKYGKTI